MLCSGFSLHLSPVCITVKVKAFVLHSSLLRQHRLNLKSTVYCLAAVSQNILSLLKFLHSVARHTFTAKEQCVDQLLVTGY